MYEKKPLLYLGTKRSINVGNVLSAFELFVRFCPFENILSSSEIGHDVSYPTLVVFVFELSLKYTHFVNLKASTQKW